MPILNGQDVRAVLLEVIQEQSPQNAMQNMQSNSVLRAAVERLGIARDNVSEQILLTEWHELFRTGHMSWGFNISNPGPPFCHVTTRGEHALGNLARDPSNPSGYMQHLNANAEINDICKSYLSESLDCYMNGLYKAAAVMLGAASESIIIELRDTTVNKINEVSGDLPRGIDDWRIKTILNALKTHFDEKKRFFDRSVKEEYEAYWSAFTQQIRAVRNDVGHPSSIEPITSDTVHASFLIFPELATLANSLSSWVINDYQ